MTDSTTKSQRVRFEEVTPTNDLIAHFNTQLDSLLTGTGLPIFPGYDDLDYIQFAYINLPSGNTVVLGQYENAPEIGVDLYIDLNKINSTAISTNIPALVVETVRYLEIPKETAIWFHPDYATEIERLYSEHREIEPISRLEPIDCFYHALEIYTRDKIPEYWAMLQHNLGLAYYHRTKGERLENLLKSIECFNKSLEVFGDRDKYPQKWQINQEDLQQSQKALNVEKTSYIVEKTSYITVIGSINQDTSVFSRSFPGDGETVTGDKTKYFPGGKGANQAVAASRHYGSCTMIGSVGTDEHGLQMLEYLKDNGVNTSLIRRIEGIETGKAIIFVATHLEGTPRIAVIPGANHHVNLPENLPKIRIAIAQFETNLAPIIDLFRRVFSEGGITLLNPSPFSPIPAELADYTSGIIVNKGEFSKLIEKEILSEPKDVISAIQSSDLSFQYCIVTLGSAGCVVYERGQEPYHVPGFPVQAIDTTGSGDCFTGTFAACLAEGLNVRDAVTRSNAAAAISVTREGAGSSMPTKSDIEAFLEKLAEGLTAQEAVTFINKEIEYC